MPADKEDENKTGVNIPCIQYTCWSIHALFFVCDMSLSSSHDLIYFLYKKKMIFPWYPTVHCLRVFWLDNKIQITEYLNILIIITHTCKCKYIQRSNCKYRDSAKQFNFNQSLKNYLQSTTEKSIMCKKG